MSNPYDDLKGRYKKEQDEDWVDCKNRPTSEYVHWLETQLIEQSPERVSVDAIVTLLHKEAEKFEKQGLIQGKIGNTHDMHGKMDTARCFRIVANTLSGDQSG